FVSFRMKFRRRLAHRDAVALALQNQSQRPANVGLVVYDDDVTCTRHSAVSGSWILAKAGSVTLNAAPPSWPSTRAMSPPERRAWRLAMERPRPMPCSLKVMVGSNNVAAASRLNPGPESCTSMVTVPLLARVHASTAP